MKTIIMKNWIQQSLLLFFLSLNTATIFAQTIFAAAYTGRKSGKILKSTDGGASWQVSWDGIDDAKLGDNTCLKDIIYQNGKLIAVGKSVLVSEDMGNSWENYYVRTHNANSPYTNGNTNFNGIAYDDQNDVYLMVGDEWQVLYSKDGKDWRYVKPQGTVQEPGNAASSIKSQSPVKKSPLKMKNPLKGKSPFKSAQPTNRILGKQTTSGGAYKIRNFKDVIFANGKFYACGGMMGNIGIAVFSFQNGKVKLEEEYMLGAINNTGEFQSIAYDGKSTFVAVANSVYGAYSTDNGKTWTKIKQPSGLQAYPITFDGKGFYALDPFRNNSIFYTENPAEGWQKTGDANSGVQIAELYYHNNTFYGVGMQSTMISSKDGQKWDLVNGGTDYTTHFANIAIVTE